MIDLPIDYALLGKAVEHYKTYGYTLINVDWMVDPWCSYATHAAESGKFRTQSSKGYAKHLVGSAEQGFIQAVSEGKVEFDKLYMSITPCFRRGDIGPVNNEWFMKLELSAVTEGDTPFHDKMLDAAWAFFAWNGGSIDQMQLYVESVNTNTDIVHLHEGDWLELGSYGYRDVTNLAHHLQKDKVLVHYGTGLALPRFQLILP